MSWGLCMFPWNLLKKVIGLLVYIIMIMQFTEFMPRVICLPGHLSSETPVNLYYYG